MAKRSCGEASGHVGPWGRVGETVMMKVAVMKGGENRVFQPEVDAGGTPAECLLPHDCKPHRRNYNCVIVHVSSPQCKQKAWISPE